MAIESRLVVAKGGGVVGGIKWEFAVSKWKLLCIDNQQAATV